MPTVKNVCCLLIPNSSSFNVHSLTLLMPPSARLKKSPAIRNNLFGPETARGLRYKQIESKPKRFVWVETTATGGPSFASPSASAFPGAETEPATGEGKGSSLYQHGFWRDTTAVSKRQGQKASLLKCKQAPPIEISLFKKNKKNNPHLVYPFTLEKKYLTRRPCTGHALRQPTRNCASPRISHTGTQPPFATGSLEERELFSVLFWFMDSQGALHIKIWQVPSKKLLPLLELGTPLENSSA